MDEEWRDIPGYEGYYQVSNWGNVRSLTRVDALNRVWFGKQLKIHLDREGYCKVELNKCGKPRKWGCHQLVMMAFVGPIPDGYTVNHISGNKTDNTPQNLEYMTREENALHSLEVLGNLRKGQDVGTSLLSEDAVREMRRLRRIKGMTYRQIGERFGVGLTTAHAAINGQNWKWVD